MSTAPAFRDLPEPAHEPKPYSPTKQERDRDHELAYWGIIPKSYL